VVFLVRWISAVLLALTLTAGNVGVCAGWMPTAETRMACCAENGTCPMHSSDSSAVDGVRVVSQADADRCCASAEHKNSNQSSPTFVTAISHAVLGTAITLPAPVPALVLSDGWRTVTPIATAHVPKHVLLSVFLV
jgi:hypothetical protein